MRRAGAIVGAGEAYRRRFPSPHNECKMSTRRYVASLAEAEPACQRPARFAAPVHQAIVDAVIFDIDGTLVDSVDLHARAWLDAIEKWGKHPGFPAVRRQIGKGGDQLLREFFTEDELEGIEKEMSGWRERHFRENFRDQVRAFPRVRELFLAIKKAGLAIALASSAKREDLEYYRKLAAIHDLLDHVSSKDDVERSKPHPDVFAAALEKLGRPDPARVIAVGDTRWDAEAAGKAGLATIGVTCGGVDAGELERAGCVAVYRDPAELFEKLERSPLLARCEDRQSPY